MGKKKKNSGKRSSRFFRWIKSDLPDEEDKKSPVLLLGVNKFSDSPSFVRRRSIDPYTTGSIRFYRPPKPKYTNNLHGDERLDRIRQDLQTHKHKSDRYIPKHKEFTIESTGRRCLNLNCARYCICDRQRSSERGSFSIRADRQSSLCLSEPYQKTDNKPDYSENEIEFKYTEHIPDIQPCSSKQHSYSVTPKSTDRKNFLLANLNERFRKTLSLDSRKVDTNRTLCLPQETRPKSLVTTSNIFVQNCKPNDLGEKGVQAKKKRKSFFSLEGIFDSKKSDTSSIDDYCSSKYKRFDLESDESPLFRRENRYQEKTPDLLNLPIIIDSVKKKHADTKRQLEKLETHYYRSLKTRPIIDCVPKDATDPKPSGSGHNGHTNHIYIEDDDVEYIEPFRSTFTSQSTLVLDKNHSGKPESILTINTDDTDIKLPSSVSPKSVEVVPENDIDSIGAYEIEVKEEDLLKNTNKLTVKVMMDKSVDSIGSCSLDVDASTDFSDTTSGSLNLLTPSSTGSRIRDFTSRIHERTQGTPTVTPNRTPEDTTPIPRPDSQRTSDTYLRPPKVSDSVRPPKVSDTVSHRSRNKKREEHKKPSYLHLACSVNGYTNLTTYDSKLRQDLNKSREASPIRPVTYHKERNSLIVPVPLGANKLLLSTFGPHDTQGDLTEKAPLKALTIIDPLAPLHVYMADENKQLKKDFLGPSMATTTRPYISTESKNFTASMLHQKDEVDNGKELTFKSSYSETNFRKTVTTNGKDSIKYQQTNSEYTISSNGVSKHIEITKENGENLTSPMKSFIQQRVERLYGPGALAQGFLMQKRQRKSTSEDDKVLTEKSLNHQIHYVPTNKFDNDTAMYSSPNTETDSGVSLPVLRHLRPEFRAQLPILSPKKSPKEIVPLKNNIPCKTETDGEKLITNGMTVINLDDSSDTVDKVNDSISELNGNANGTASDKLCKIEVVPLVNSGEVVKDVYYFLELKRIETERLIELAVSAEKELQELQKQDTSEEVLGLLRAASGKARLLATQKMQQFEGLCHNHINQSVDEPFPTTVQDLQGFWDMVCLQVTSVDQLYEHLAVRRNNQWREESPPRAPCPSASSGRPRPRAVPAQHNERARLAAEKRDEDRKAMLEHRRRVARERMLASRAAAPGTSREQPAGLEGSQEVEIFVGKSAKPSKVAPRGDCMSTPNSEESIQS